MKKTTHRYILKEISPIFLIGLMTFTVILLMDKILRLIELIVTRGGSLPHILMLFGFIAPSFLIFTIPVAVLLGTLLTFGRLSGDSEIVAFKASGISLYQLFFPIAIFSILSYLLTTFLVFYGLPWGNKGFRETLYLIIQSNANIEIKERVFTDLFDGLVVYVDKVPLQGKKMQGILIHDERDKERLNTIFAREGVVITLPEKQEVVLRLMDGDIHRFEPRVNVFQKVKFDTYDLKLELIRAYDAIGKKLKDHEMSIVDIKEKMEALKKKGVDTTPQEVELHKRYAIPFACLVFGLIGVPLGIQPRRSGKSYGFVFSIFILLAYYISMILFELFAMQKKVPPFFAGWAPNLLFAVLGIYLLVKTANESPFKPVVWLVTGLDFLQGKLKRIFGDD